jgi:hypothetical protein
MELIFGINNIVIGSYMIIVGFKIYNPYKNKNEKEKEEKFYSKFGLFFKIGGIALLLFGLIKTISKI